MLTPLGDKHGGTYRGGKGTKPVTTECPQASKENVVIKTKNKNSTLEVHQQNMSQDENIHEASSVSTNTAEQYYSGVLYLQQQQGAAE